MGMGGNGKGKSHSRTPLTHMATVGVKGLTGAKKLTDDQICQHITTMEQDIRSPHFNFFHYLLTNNTPKIDYTRGRKIRLR